MDETKKGAERAERDGRPCSEPTLLPEWALLAIRPMGIGVSRLLWRIEYRGTENIPMRGGLIVAANHQTYFDPFWVGFPIKRPLRFLAWNETFGWPIVGKLLSRFGAWPLQLERSDPAAIRRAIQWLRKEGAIVIFPEGGRGNPDGGMVRFKHGAARMALEAGVPILPVTIRGAHRIWPKTRRIPAFGRKVEVHFHPPIRVEAQADEDNRVCARRESERIADIIRSKL
jgi:1-acyl-sn-glycerol-3-phosphate acyltransferase